MPFSALHANHPATATIAIPHVHTPRPPVSVESPDTDALRAQIAGHVLRGKQDSERIAALEEELAASRRRVEVLETLVRCDDKVRSGNSNRAAAAVTPVKTASGALVPAPPPVMGHGSSLPSISGGNHAATPGPRRRPMSSLETDRDRSAAVEPLLMRRTQTLQQAMTEVVETSTAVNRHWQEDTAALELQIATLRDDVKELTEENQSLRKRVAEEVLNKRLTANLNNALGKLQAQRRTREASRLRLEALERSAMMAHDDVAYTRRWAARDFPNERVALVFVDFVPYTQLTQQLPHLERLVMDLYLQQLAEWATQTNAHVSHQRGATLLLILPNATDALHFVQKVNDALVGVEWPETLAHEQHFGRVRDPASGKVIFAGPRVRFGLSFGSFATDFSAEEGHAYAFGAEVAAAGKVAAYARPGEICASNAFRDRLEEELGGVPISESPFGDLSQWYGTALSRQLNGVSMLPPEYQGRRAVWKREYGVASSLRQLVPEWSAKLEAPLHWAKPLGVAPTLHIAKARRRRSLSMRQTKSFTTSPGAQGVAGGTPSGTNAAAAPLNNNSIVTSSTMVIPSPVMAVTTISSSFNAPSPRNPPLNPLMDEEPPGLSRAASAASVSLPFPSKPVLATVERRALRVRGLLCAAERALEANERSRMAAFDTIANASVRAPGNEPFLVVGRIGAGSELRNAVPVAVYAETQRTFLAEAKQLVARYNGYWVKSEAELFISAFERLHDAVQYTAMLHLHVLSASWPAAVLQASPVVSVTVPAEQPGAPPLRRAVTGGVMAALSLEKLTTGRAVFDPASGRTDYIGLSVHIACQMCAHARPGETLVAEEAARRLKESRFVHEYSLAGQGLHAVPGVVRPIEGTTLLPLDLGVRFKLWASQAKAAQGKLKVSAAEAKAAERLLSVKPMPDADVSVRMRYLLRLHKDAAAAVASTLGQRQSVITSPMAAPLAVDSTSVAALKTPDPALARALRLVPKLAEDRRRLLRKLQNVETFEMANHDEAQVSVPHVGHAAIVVFDLEGSEKLHRAFKELFVVAQRHFNHLAITIAKDYEGYRAKHNGFDAFVYVFSDTAKAVRFCSALQVALLGVDWPSDLMRNELSLRVKDAATGATFYNGPRCRMGVSYGAVVSNYDEHTQRTEYAGHVLMAAARTSRYGRGGDVLLTAEAMSDLEARNADSDGDTMAWLTVVPKKEPQSKGTPIFAVYSTSLAGRAKGLLERPAKERAGKGSNADEGKGSNWWRQPHSGQHVNAARMTPEAVAAATASLSAAAAKAAENAGGKDARGAKGGKLSPRASTVASPTRRTSSVASRAGKAGADSRSKKAVAGAVPSAETLALRRKSAESLTRVPSMVTAPVPTGQPLLPEAAATKLQDLIRRLIARVEATHEATHGVPNYQVSYAKVGRELDAVLRVMQRVLDAAAPWTVAAGKTRLTEALEKALGEYGDLGAHSVDLQDDAETVERHARMIEASQAVCQRCGTVFRNAMYCSATGLLHLPRSTFYVYNLTSNVISAAEIRMLADAFAAEDPHEFGRLSFQEVQRLASTFGEALDEATYYTRMCSAEDGCVSLEDIAAYLYASMPRGAVESAVSEALTAPAPASEILGSSAEERRDGDPQSRSSSPGLEVGPGSMLITNANWVDPFADPAPSPPAAASTSREGEAMVSLSSDDDDSEDAQAME